MLLLSVGPAMPEQSVTVWDLETVPDLPTAARMLGLGAAAEAEVRQALGEGFPKHSLHKIVCIGALVASRQAEGWRVDALGAPHTGERPEADLIKAFAEKVGQLRPQLVTWNGHSFDLPVLRYRAMVNRVAARRKFASSWPTGRRPISTWERRLEFEGFAGMEGACGSLRRWRLA
jgi:predicted PolB exonuclease-like 3'-5' exonuclease